jgi:hypothetical protein
VVNVSEAEETGQVAVATVPPAALQLAGRVVEEAVVVGDVSITIPVVVVVGDMSVTVPPVPVKVPIVVVTVTVPDALVDRTKPTAEEAAELANPVPVDVTVVVLDATVEEIVTVGTTVAVVVPI